MSEPIRRTADWPRLRQSGFLTVDDQPDRITVGNIIGGWPLFMMGWQALMGTLAALAILSLVVSQNVVTYILTCLFLGLMMRGIMIYWPLYLSTAHKVTFTADHIHFHGLFGNDLGSLPREAMQQIAVGENKAGKHTVSYHHFMADTGWVRAMPTFDRDNMLVRNNLLMSAFSQPLHLSTPQPDYVAAPIMSPPDVAGLRPVATQSEQ